MVDPKGRRVSRSVQGLVACGFVITFSVVGWQLLHKHAYTLDSIRELKNVYDGLLVPDDAKELQSMRVVNKVLLQSVSNHYSTSHSASEVDAFFSSQLQPQGWKVVEQVEPEPGEILVRYCNSGMTIVIETGKTRDLGNKFYLAVSRGNQPAYGWFCN